MEREMTSVQSQYKAIEQPYGQDPSISSSRAASIKMLGNSAVVRYLKQRQPDVLREFEAVVKTAALD